jgi:predicted  nucleic acid-binding Zn-ribbon protein
MDNTLTYILELKSNVDAKLKQINILNDQQLASWGKVQTQVNAANATMSNMGRSIGSLSQRVAALRAQKEWIPAGNTVAIRATNREIKSLEAEINRLNSLNGVNFPSGGGI